MVYKFGRYTFSPEERLLVGEDTRVRLPPIPLRLLTFIVHSGGAGKVLTKDELLAAVWGSTDATADRQVEENNLNVGIGRLRKVLKGDARTPEYIETIPSIGYSLIPAVEVLPDDNIAVLVATSAVSRTSPRVSNSRQGFVIESHKFVPTYLGRTASKHLAQRGRQRTSSWGEYSEICLSDARLCVFSCGVGVWHLRERTECVSITDLAIWRRRTYQIVLSGQHPEISRSVVSDQLAKSRSSDWAAELIGEPAYVLSLLNLERHPWRDESQFRTALRLLCSPSALQSEDGSDIPRHNALHLEEGFFRTGFNNPEIREFGVPGIDLGFASWAGVSYGSIATGRSSLTERIVEFELSLQALWWLCGSIQRIALGGRPLPPAVRSLAPVIRRHLAHLQTIGPREPIEQRTMVEAVFATSRMKELAADALSLLT